MFGDFITLSADQIINHIAKFRQMYDNQVEVPIVIRTPMGGGRGYGPTHSQSLEKLFLGIPGLKVVAPSHFHDSGKLLEKSVSEDSDPVLFVEHKLLYPVRLLTESDKILQVETRDDKLGYPVAIVRNFSEGGEDVVIISYGGYSGLLEPLMRTMKAEEINITACFPSLISSTPMSVLEDIVKSCGKVILIEEGAGLYGWTAETAAQIYEISGKYLKRPIKRIVSYDSVIPAAKHLENDVLPNDGMIENAIEEMLL